MNMMNKKPPAPDIVILVMGPTGAGKSTFINHLLGRPVMKVGKALSSCTSDLQFASLDPTKYPHLKDRVVIVDTPGFDDTYKGDEAILRKIADWLGSSYKKKQALLGGVIYLHDISHNRFTGTARRNLEMLQHFCGQDALRKVILGASMWTKTDPADANKHLEELKAKYWTTLIAKGAHVEPFLDETASAWVFVNALISNLRRQKLETIYLQIQTELVDEKKTIPETEAGKELRFTLKEVLEMQQKMVKVDRSLAAEGDEQARLQLQEAEEKIKLLASQVKALKIPFSRKLRKVFGL